VDARRAFLENIENEVSAPVVTGKRVRRVSGFAAGVLAGVSFLTLTAGVASADVSSPGAGGVQAAASNCYQPDHVPWTHVKQCAGITWVRHVYKYTYSPNQALQCYVFDSEVNNPCGSGTFESESCAA